MLLQLTVGPAAVGCHGYASQISEDAYYSVLMHSLPQSCSCWCIAAGTCKPNKDLYKHPHNVCSQSRLARTTLSVSLCVSSTSYQCLAVFFASVKLQIC